MEFLDEQIAKLQKEARRARKYDANNKEEHEEIEENIKELSQEEVTQEDLKELSKEELKELTKEKLTKEELTQAEVNAAIKNGSLEKSGEKLVFEKKTCFKGKIIIPIIEDFFDEYQEEDNGYCWVKKQSFSIALVKIDSENNSENIDDLLKKIKDFYKENDIYVEFLKSKEEPHENYNKYILSSRMPTAIDYIYQYMMTINFKNESIILMFTCLEKDKKQWEKVMVGISELIEINEGDKEANEGS